MQTAMWPTSLIITSVALLGNGALTCRRAGLLLSLVCCRRAPRAWASHNEGDSARRLSAPGGLGVL
eukprot:196012-Lingulodinium_polyedra.AAC.1